MREIVMPLITEFFERYGDGRKVSGQSDIEEDFMQNLIDCQVCKGNIWGGGKHKYYNGTYEHPELIKARKESDRLMSQMGQDTDNFVDDIRVMTLPFSWAEKGFFSKKVVDIETIKICVLCFTASADHENKLYRGSGGDWKPRETKEGEIIAYYLRTFERQIWYRDHQSGILNGDPAYRLYVIMANIKDVLMKVAADTDKYRKLVTSLADKE